jgi:hypothetical protein
VLAANAIQKLEDHRDKIAGNEKGPPTKAAFIYSGGRSPGDVSHSFK